MKPGDERIQEFTAELEQAWEEIRAILETCLEPMRQFALAIDDLVAEFPELLSSYVEPHQPG